jgi:succinoglycan biosynthesis transport protein ExoP
MAKGIILGSYRGLLRQIAANAVGAIVGTILLVLAVKVSALIWPGTLQSLWANFSRPTSVPRWLVLISGGIGLVIIATAAINVLESLRGSVHQVFVRRIERVTKLPVLGSVSARSAHPPPTNMTEMARVGFLLPLNPGVDPRMLEEFRWLRHSISKRQRSINRRQRGIYLITSSNPFEGKSCVCANLAVAMALNGRRVTLVDLDLRLPKQHILFNLDENVGFTNVVRREVTLAAALQSTAISNLKVLTSGSVQPNAAELISSREAETILKSLRKTEDFVFVDAPPALAFVDTSIIAELVDNIVFVVSGMILSKYELSKLISAFKDAKALMLGIVLNKVGKRDASDVYYYGEPEFEFDDEDAEPS